MPKDSPGRIATLDGLRAISILLVFAAHLQPHTRLASMCGDLGVRTFFVISGFLITTLLVRERDKTGSISLRGFYLRRVFRIFPAFYVYLAGIGILTAIGWIAVDRDNFLYAAFYGMNYQLPDTRAWQVGHLWSLAVEEQFYLLWPAVMALLGTPRAKRVAIATVAIVPVIRLVGYYTWPQTRDISDSAFPYVADSLACGCILAIARPQLEAWPLYRRVIDSPVFWAIPALGIAALSISSPRFNLPVGVTLGNLAIAMTLHRCVLHADGAIGRLLERTPLIWIGTLSYSLYLWQQLFLDRHSSAWPNQLPWNVGFAVAAGITSYYLVERPILRWYGRFSKRVRS